jgi:hypothetical protein
MKTFLSYPFVAMVILFCVDLAVEGAELERRHPGHKMEIAFLPTKDAFAPDEPVKVDLRIKNVGDTEFMFMRGGRQRGARDNQFGFTAQAGDRMLPDIGSPIHFGGLGSYVRVKPKETIEIPVDLKKWFAFSAEGFFELRGTYYMRFSVPDAEDHRPIWEDFACAEFSITIRKDR